MIRMEDITPNKIAANQNIKNHLMVIQKNFWNARYTFYNGWKILESFQTTVYNYLTNEIEGTL